MLRDLACERDARFVQAISDQLDDYVAYFDINKVYDYDVEQIEKMLINLLLSNMIEDLPAKMQVALAAVLAEYHFHYDPKDWQEEKNKYEEYVVYIDKQVNEKISKIIGWIMGGKWGWRWPKFMFGYQEAILPPDEIKEKLTEEFKKYIELRYGSIKI
jgi:frataxin-like iron-binding protein CyaY